MPFHYRYLAESNCLYTIGEGKVSLQEFLDYHDALQIPNPQPSLLILADYRRLDPSDLTTADIKRIRDSALKKIENQFETVREATVVSNGLAYGLTRMFDGVVHSEDYELNVFTDIAEAKHWLGVAPDICLDEGNGTKTPV